jgi:hypothetical protein
VQKTVSHPALIKADFLLKESHRVHRSCGLTCPHFALLGKLAWLSWVGKWHSHKTDFILLLPKGTA